MFYNIYYLCQNFHDPVSRFFLFAQYLKKSLMYKLLNNYSIPFIKKIQLFFRNFLQNSPGNDGAK